MHFDFTEEQRRLFDEAVAFARSELNYDMIERDAHQSFSRDGWDRCARFGVHALPVPSEYGGKGVGALAMLAVMEGLGYGCRDQGLLFSINAHLWTNTIPLLRYGTTEQKQRFLPGLSDGRLIGANGASEPEAGSDIFSMTTRASKEGSDYILNGRKVYVTSAPIADVFTLYATLNPAYGPTGICCFLVERSAPGLTTSRRKDKLGLRTAQMGEIHLENCRVPATSLLGREGRGVEVFNCSMAWERACILAACLGTMRRQLEQCVERARKRKQFGQPIGKFQSVANRIVDMRLRYETSRLIIYKVGWLLETGKSADIDSAMAKLHVSEAFVQSCLDAIQIHGASGFLTETELERDLRDSIGSRLFSGTSEIQRNIIARAMRL